VTEYFHAAEAPVYACESINDQKRAKNEIGGRLPEKVRRHAE
jgi:hypothetical protein